MSAMTSAARRALLCALVAWCVALPGTAQDFFYSRIGNHADAQTTPSFGLALMGGGSDQDEAFRWLCEKANGGDFLVLTAARDDDYNPYVNKLCRLNSVATLGIFSKKDAENPAVAEIVRQAEAVFITGGDQAKYVNYWTGTPLQQALNDGIAAGKPIGGTSAGLAVLPQFAYSAQGDAPNDKNLSSSETLANPLHPRITLVPDFLRIPLLRDVVTDTHFAKRDRLGRTLVFLARLLQDGHDPRAIGVDERSVVLVDADGAGKVAGTGKGAYFIRPEKKPEALRANAPLTLASYEVYFAPPGATFDIKHWKGAGGTQYQLFVRQGRISSSKAGGDIY